MELWNLVSWCNIVESLMIIFIHPLTKEQRIYQCLKDSEDAAGEKNLVSSSEKKLFILRLIWNGRNFPFN